MSTCFQKQRNSSAKRMNWGYSVVWMIKRQCRSLMKRSTINSVLLAAASLVQILPMNYPAEFEGMTRPSPGWHHKQQVNWNHLFWAAHCLPRNSYSDMGPNEYRKLSWSGFCKISIKREHKTQKMTAVCHAIICESLV